MKRVHKALQLRQHKHTAKILPHKHTSYGALFVLMCIPIFVMALVGHFVSASDYLVSATVPAPMPTAAPTITSPTDGTVTESGSVTVTGTCPIAQPAVVIVVYNGSNVVGSVQCSTSGNYSLQVSLTYGANSLRAAILTITGEAGQTSSTVVVTRKNTKLVSSGQSQNESNDGLGVPFYVLPTDLFVPIRGDGQVTWQGKLIGGKAPYRVFIDWGDGTNSQYDVATSEVQAFVHKYSDIKPYQLTITAIDSTGDKMSYQTAVIMFLQPKRALLDASSQQVHPIVGFVQQNALQIYIFTLSGLIFLWYLEHGRHVAKQLIGQSVHVRMKRHRRKKV